MSTETTTPAKAERLQNLRPRKTTAGRLGRMLVTDDGRVRAQVKTVHSGPAYTMVVFKVWIDDVCHHYVIDEDTGAVLAEGRDNRERRSWQMARQMLVARGLLDPDDQQDA
jgi:hypothetical protein